MLKNHVVLKNLATLIESVGVNLSDNYVGAVVTIKLPFQPYHLLKEQLKPGYLQGPPADRIVLHYKNSQVHISPNNREDNIVTGQIPEGVVE